MKKQSFERVVGNVPEEEKDKILREKGQFFDSQDWGELKNIEHEKKQEELQIIDLANQMTNEVVKKYGLQDFDIPAQNIHIIYEKYWRQKNTGGTYLSNLQAVLIRENPTKIGLVETMFHEMLHFKSYQALQLTKGENPRESIYRNGLISVTRDGERTRFSNLNEAVTEETVKKYFQEHYKDLSRNPILSQEIFETKVNENQWSSVAGSDYFYLGAKGSLVGGLNQQKFSYKEERKILNDLIDKLLEKNKDKFKNKEEIFDLFAKGMITGNILPIGRLIENSFGKGTFRKIGELDGDIEAQEKLVDSL